MNKKWQASFNNMTYDGWSQSSQIKCVNVKPSYTENSVRQNQAKHNINLKKVCQPHRLSKSNTVLLKNLKILKLQTPYVFISTIKIVQLQ